jgi:hypothetical protein
MLGSAVFGSDITDHWFAVAHGGDIAFICRHAEGADRKRLDRRRVPPAACAGLR